MALDFMTCQKMNTESMGSFSRVCHADPDELIDMVLDGASSHKGKELEIPGRCRLCFCAPFRAQSAEQIWNVLRRNYFANKVFDSLDAATG